MDLSYRELLLSRVSLSDLTLSTAFVPDEPGCTTNVSLMVIVMCRFSVYNTGPPMSWYVAIDQHTTATFIGEPLFFPTFRGMDATRLLPLRKVL